jgi:PTH1 family peptidyl-tRNA hydrolase
MKLVVGLGNPGTKYRGTRHNVGFEVIAEVARRNGAGPGVSKFRGEVYNCTVGGTKTLLLMPQTFMNASGSSVRGAVDFYKIPISDVLVVGDDFNLPLGRLRFRAKGSAGGQKGLDNVLQQLGTDEVSRLRLGIGIPPASKVGADFVLSKFARHEQPEVETMVLTAADGVVDWIEKGIEYCMNRYNAN